MLEQVSALVSGSLRGGGVATPLLYAMLHQRWRSRPGVLVPRTLVVTELGLLLCDEDYAGNWPVAAEQRRKRSARGGGGAWHLPSLASPLGRARARLASPPPSPSPSLSPSPRAGEERPMRVAEAASLGEIVYIRADEEPHCLTVKLKTPFFGRQRKWRLVSASKAQADRILADLRRFCTALRTPSRRRDEQENDSDAD